MLRPRIAIALDWAAIVLVVLGVGFAWSGGFYTEIGGVRISARNADRALLLAAIVFAIRWWRGGATPPFGIDRTRWREWWSGIYRPEADAVPTVQPGHWQRVALAAIGIAAFGAVLLAPQIRRLDAVPDFGDPLFSVWRMGWVYHQLQGDPRPLFGGNIFYPTPLVLTFSDSMLLPSLMAAPLRAAGLHPMVVYNVAFLSSFLLAGLATYLLAERLTGSGKAAFIAALIYGFYPYRFEHYSHFELQMTFWMPLALIWLHAFSQSLKLRDALVAAAIMAGQLYSSMYYGVFFLIYSAAVLGTLLVIARHHVRRWMLPVASGLALFVLLATPLARPYLAAQSLKGERDEGAVRHFSAWPSDYLRAHLRSATYGKELRGGRSERELFPGTLPIVLSIAGLMPPLGATRLAYAVGLVTAFDVSLGFNGVSYKHLYRWMLPLRGMRVPARMSVILGISLAVLSAFGVRRLLQGMREGWGRMAVFAAFIAGAAIDFRPTVELYRVWREPPTIYETLKGQQVVLAEFPSRDSLPFVTESVPFMYFSLWHWLPIVNGYSGFAPADYPEFVETLQGFPNPASIAALRARGVTHVTVNCGLYRSGCPELLQQIEGVPALRLMIENRWRGQPVRLYELIK